MKQANLLCLALVASTSRSTWKGVPAFLQLFVSSLSLTGRSVFLSTKSHIHSSAWACQSSRTSNPQPAQPASGVRPNMAEASASSSQAPSHAPIRGPGSHRVHSSCDRCRSRKTKVGRPCAPCSDPCRPADDERSASIQVRRPLFIGQRRRHLLRDC
jgi:hypothetical protein